MRVELTGILYDGDERSLALSSTILALCIHVYHADGRPREVTIDTLKRDLERQKLIIEQIRSAHKNIDSETTPIRYAWCASKAQSLTLEGHHPLLHVHHRGSLTTSTNHTRQDVLSKLDIVLVLLIYRCYANSYVIVNP